MRKYYTRPCNFYYGNYAKKLIKKKKALSLAGNPNIAFDQLEIFQRKKKRIVQNIICPISEIKTLSEEITSTIKADLKKITSRRKSICGLKFDNPQIMGALNITPDSFSDGGLFFKRNGTRFQPRGRLQVDSQRLRIAREQEKSNFRKHVGNILNRAIQDGTPPEEDDWNSIAERLEIWLRRRKHDERPVWFAPARSDHIVHVGNRQNGAWTGVSCQCKPSAETLLQYPRSYS